jgi:hypothetical protein
MDERSYFMIVSSDILSRSLAGMCHRGLGGAYLSPFLIYVYLSEPIVTDTKISVQVI